jgi:hypothetical protein
MLPTPKQKRALVELFGAVRRGYNKAVAVLNGTRAEARKPTTAVELREVVFAQGKHKMSQKPRKRRSDAGAALLSVPTEVHKKLSMADFHWQPEADGIDAELFPSKKMYAAGMDCKTLQGGIEDAWDAEGSNIAKAAKNPKHEYNLRFRAYNVVKTPTETVSISAGSWLKEFAQDDGSKAELRRVKRQGGRRVGVVRQSTKSHATALALFAGNIGEYVRLCDSREVINNLLEDKAPQRECKVQWDKRMRNFYLLYSMVEKCHPMEAEEAAFHDDEVAPIGATDPGVHPFQRLFSPTSEGECSDVLGGVLPQIRVRQLRVDELQRRIDRRKPPRKTAVRNAAAGEEKRKGAIQSVQGGDASVHQARSRAAKPHCAPAGPSGVAAEVLREEEAAHYAALQREKALRGERAVVAPPAQGSDGSKKRGRDGSFVSAEKPGLVKKPKSGSGAAASRKGCALLTGRQQGAPELVLPPGGSLLERPPFPRKPSRVQDESFDGDEANEAFWTAPPQLPKDAQVEPKKRERCAQEVECASVESLETSAKKRKLPEISEKGKGVCSSSVMLIRWNLCLPNVPSIDRRGSGSARCCACIERRGESSAVIMSG